ncbi:hypothetical protein BDZ89DRAFT_1061759 [Hymenopellis radicata]|nr:hypothetical protein BDZ89DRAFT_1061759 [Hymenopellis radicata]
MDSFTSATMNSSSLKRKHEDDDDDDDDISIASRTPSPPPDAMDVDKYDEYSHAASHEVITVETRLKSTNKGFAMLAKLGWAEGQPLGISGDGRVDPIPFQMKADATGVGKMSQDVRMIETTVSQRRGLDSERQTKETEEQRRMREDDAARRSAIASEVSDILKAFYCSLCDKQFKNVAQYDEHTNSYAHHHKARYHDMQQNVRMQPKDEVEKRKEKERKREEKELRKIAAANGIRMTKSTTAPLLATANDEAAVPVSATASPPSSSPSGFKKLGWSEQPPPPPTTLHTEPPLHHPHDAQPRPPLGFKKSGWAPVALPSSRPSSPSPGSNLPDDKQQPLGTSSFGTAPTPAPTEPHSSKAQASRLGWQQFQKSNSRRY